MDAQYQVHGYIPLRFLYAWGGGGGGAASFDESGTQQQVYNGLMNILTGEATLLFLPPILIEVNSNRKEFAPKTSYLPKGANSFI